MGKIGFKWGNWRTWGGSSSTESKWETSFYGGYNRLVSDYPRVVVNSHVDFDFAPIEYLSYYDKEKILKIFLSKSKSNALTDKLMANAKTESETSMLYGKIIKTEIHRDSKAHVLALLNSIEKEYAPLFKHYKDFILDSGITFKQPEGSGGESPENKNEKNQDQNQDNDKKNDKKNQGENQNNDDNRDKNKDNENQDGKQKDQNKNDISDNDILKNLIDFEQALKDVKEEEFKYDSVCNFPKKTQLQIQSSRGVETIYSQEENDIAESLNKMLDISFDPTEDTVKNLRLGKLDITKIAEVPAGNIAIYKQTVENQTTKPFSVAILCDESGSMESADRIRPQLRIVKSLYKCFSDILPQEKIFVYGHTGGENPELYVYHDPYNQNFLTTIDQMLNHRYRSNYDGPIIEEIHKNIRNTTDDRIIFIVLSDGTPAGQNYGGRQAYENMRQIIEKCKRDEFVTVGVGIGSIHVKDLYQYSTIVTNLNDMPKKVSHIVNHVVKTEFQ